MRLFALAALLTAALAAPLVGVGAVPQNLPPPPPPVRDPGPPPPGRGRGTDPVVRTIPVGSGSISGVITAGDSGRPVSGVRVSLNGTAGNPAVIESLVTAMRGAANAPGAGRGTANGQTVTINGVTLTASQLSLGVSRSVMTDAQGQFAFEKLPAGQFLIVATKNQFLMSNYGQKRPGGQGSPINLGEGQRVTITMALARGGAISGVVFDQDGNPQENAQVSAWRYQYNNGVRRLYQNNSTQTDDRGAFRLHNLQPGDYLIGARPMTDFSVNDRMITEMQAVESAIASGQVKPPAAPGLPPTVSITVAPPQMGPVEGPPGYLPTFYGGSTSRTSAQIVHVDGNDERLGVDIVVQPVRSTNITGYVAVPQTPGVSVQVSLIADDPLTQNNFGSTRVGQDGRFSMRDIVPGKYTVFAVTVPAPVAPVMSNGVMVGPQTTPRLDDSQKMWGRATVNVAGEPTVTVNLSMMPARTISGVVISEMTRPPDFSRMMVTLNQAPGYDAPSFGPQPNAAVGADGRFTMGGVTPGRYVLRVGSTMKSSMVDGDDSLDFPFEFNGDRDIRDAVLTITDKITELSGKLSDPAGKPTTGYNIVVASTDPRYWTPGSRRITQSRPGFDGTYTLRGLPPGDYFVAVTTEFDFGMQYDPEFLKTLASSATVRVTLMEGEKRTQDLRVAIR